MQKKVINTRISKDIYDKISAKARKNRVTVSNLIRNIVEDSLEIYEDVADLVDEKIKYHLHKHDTATIIGYQSLTLTKDITCDICGKGLKKGTRAHIAFLENSPEKLIVCEESKQELEKEEEEEEKK